MYGRSYNNAPRRGRHLRDCGDELGNTPEYSDDLDHSQAFPSYHSHPRGQEGSERSRMTEDQQNPPKASRALRGKTGLIIKEPLL